MVSDIIGFLLLIVLVMAGVALLPISRIRKSGVFAISCGLLFSPVLIIGHGVGIAPFLPVLISAPVFLLGLPSAVSFLATTGLAFVIGWVVLPAISISMEVMKHRIAHYIGSDITRARIAQIWFALHFLLVLTLLYVQGAAIASITYTG